MTASLLTSVGPGKNLVDRSGAGGNLLSQSVLERHFAEPGRAAERQGIFTRRFSAPAGEARLELSRNYSLPDLT